MKVTVKELIEKLYEFAPDAAIAVEDLVDDQEFFLVSLQPGDNRVVLVITDEEEEDEEQKEEEEKEYG